jgi:hypothetical protein
VLQLTMRFYHDYNLLIEGHIASRGTANPPDGEAGFSYAGMSHRAPSLLLPRRASAGDRFIVVSRSFAVPPPPPGLSEP